MMNDGQMACAIGALLVLGQAAGGIEYKKSVISGVGMTNRATFVSFSSSTFSFGGSNVTRMSTSGPMEAPAEFGGFGWGDRGFGPEPLEARIHEAQARLDKLLFMRDVCPKLEDDIRIDFEKRDIREVLALVSTILGAKLPYEVPEGVHLVEKSEVHGMPADRFLDSVARVCGLSLRFEKDKLVFEKPQDQAMSPGVDADQREPPEAGP